MSKWTSRIFTLVVCLMLAGFFPGLCFIIYLSESEESVSAGPSRLGAK